VVREGISGGRERGGRGERGHPRKKIRGFDTTHF
jgi:hypothetical protein